MTLNEDELGQLGQDEFQTLCSKSKLIANPSIRDRTGWDFRVEYPNSELAPNEPFDKRSVPSAIMVQVKTVRETTNKVTLNLRTFERLIKISDPAFIVIPEFDQQDRIVGYHGIHLVGEALAKPLKRLAQIHAKGRQIAEHDAVSYTRKRWWKFFSSVHDNPLRTYFEENINSYATETSYAETKCKELAELGYDDGVTHSICHHAFRNVTQSNNRPEHPATNGI
jgi:hypothetical protein